MNMTAGCFTVESIISSKASFWVAQWLLPCSVSLNPRLRLQPTRAERCIGAPKRINKGKGAKRGVQTLTIFKVHSSKHSSNSTQCPVLRLYVISSDSHTPRIVLLLPEEDFTDNAFSPSLCCRARESNRGGRKGKETGSRREVRDVHVFVRQPAVDLVGVTQLVP
ncbi:uncharacterized [Tachysurus ichikawai]